MNLIPFPDVKCHKEFFFHTWQNNRNFRDHFIQLGGCVFVGRYQRVFHLKCALNATYLGFTAIKLPKAPCSARRYTTLIEMEGKWVRQMVEFGVFKARTLMCMGRFLTQYNYSLVTIDTRILICFKEQIMQSFHTFFILTSLFPTLFYVRRKAFVGTPGCELRQAGSRLQAGHSSDLSKSTKSYSYSLEKERC